MTEVSCDMCNNADVICPGQSAHCAKGHHCLSQFADCGMEPEHCPQCCDCGAPVKQGKMY